MDVNLLVINIVCLERTKQAIEIKQTEYDKQFF